MTEHAKIPLPAVSLHSLCDYDGHLSAVQIHDEPNGERAAVASDGRIAGLVTWHPEYSSHQPTPWMIPSGLLRAMEGYFPGLVEPYDGKAPSILPVLREEPKPDSFRIGLDTRLLIRVLRYMQAACGRPVVIEATFTSASDMVVIEPAPQYRLEGVTVRTAIMPVATRPLPELLRPSPPRA